MDALAHPSHEAAVCRTDYPPVRNLTAMARLVTGDIAHLAETIAEASQA